ncbi:hypothetical protein FW778_17650 [Ginsengibacter hankyongi]|uniref:Uncharacterized protein n=1 Tax=Ginsengibacter hankyongi TaxID=2607284 RepID=A0A5J5IHL5_9BACT|nr:hypothetical protein [Ginsengibacter hankyongi]KAA9037252.1 hypothetical protein FW778_17650 [Ginsengibacter hankyongi]
MDTDYTIKKLREQRLKVNQNDTEVWLKTTYSFLEEYFKSYSPRAGNFHELIYDFATKKIFGFKPGEIAIIKNQAIQYLDENIQYLEEQLEKERKDSIQKVALAKQYKEQQARTETNKPMAIPQTQPEIIIKMKTQLPFGIAPAFFWTVFAGLISAAFILGQSIGSSKFDREKSDYYEDLKVLRQDTVNLNRTILLKDSIVLQKDSIIKNKQDSLIQMDKILTGFSLLLSNQQTK